MTSSHYGDDNPTRGETLIVMQMTTTPLNYVIIDTSSSFASNLPHDYRFFTNIFKSQRDSKVRPIFFQ